MSVPEDRISDGASGDKVEVGVTTIGGLKSYGPRQSVPTLPDYQSISRGSP